MSTRSCFAIVTTIFVLTAATQLCAQTAYTPDLPAGPLQAKVATACTVCHETRIILQQRLSKAAWTKEIDKMVKWGAVVDPEDRDAFIDYLSGNFGVDKPAYVADRSASSPKPAKK
jgi:hypothetical protein